MLTAFKLVKCHWFLLAESLPYSAVFEGWQIEDPTSASWLGGNTKPWMYIILRESSRLLLEIGKHFPELLIAGRLHRRKDNSLAFFSVPKQLFPGHGWKQGTGLEGPLIWLIMVAVASLWSNSQLELCLITVGKGGSRQMIQLGIKRGCIDEELWKWSYLTVEMKLKIAAVQQILLLFNSCCWLKCPLIFKVLIILLWQSAKWPYYVDHKMSTRHTHCPHLADYFF